MGAYQQPQYEQQAQYAQQQTAYAPPAGNYAPVKAGQTGKGGGWIGFLRVFLWIFFGLLCLVGVIGFAGMAANGQGGPGMLILLGCILLAFLSVAGGMIALDAAKNISRCATNSARILELLQREK